MKTKYRIGDRVSFDLLGYCEGVIVAFRRIKRKGHDEYTIASLRTRSPIKICHAHKLRFIERLSNEQLLTHELEDVRQCAKMRIV